jgi:hypothetical protein
MHLTAGQNLTSGYHFDRWSMFDRCAPLAAAPHGLAVTGVTPQCI